ncbi:hypothetical protein SDC9_21331 [bioreactor metagenome]|uniref:Uncharacterized protein n=1 Tax=bioreactor metagenome TaxID=1076179 RepID=A0A644U980_9ZZZZ
MARARKGRIAAAPAGKGGGAAPSARRASPPGYLGQLEAGSNRASAPWRAVEFEGIAHRGVILVAEPAEPVGRQIAPPGEAVGADVDAGHLAMDQEVRLAEQRDHLHQPAFEGGRGLRDARAVDRLAFGLLEARDGELVRSRGQRRRGGVHRPDQLGGDEVDAEHPAFADLCEAVLGVAAVGFRRGRGEDHLRRGIGDGVEEGIGGEIVAKGAARRDPADRARRDDRIERVVRQAVTIGGAVEHGGGDPFDLNLTLARVRRV